MNQELFRRGQETIAQGIGWLGRHHDQISHTQDLSAYYKAPYLYATLADPVRARYCADLMQTRYLQQDGDFRTGPQQKGWADAPVMPATWYIYPTGWIIVGLRKMGAYGIAKRGIQFVRRFQSPELGGFFSRFDVKSGQVDRRYVDSSSTSAAGLALLACGLVEEAIQAGDFILRLLEAQPDPERHCYLSWQAGAGLMTDLWDAQGRSPIGERRLFALSTDVDPLQQLTWLAGKSMKFLSKLYDQTSDRKYLDGAIQLFEFFHRLDEGRWRNTGSCKVMWASAELYRHTGEPRFAQTAERIFDTLCQAQQPSGCWVHTARGGRPEDQPLTISVDIVQELCAEMLDTMFDLSPTAGSN